MGEIIVQSFERALPPAGAKFSEDRKYRYVLWRHMNTTLPIVAYIGLNPSTANENTNDRTIQKLIKITLNNGYGGFYMLNLFGIISSKPEILVNHPDPIGDNDIYLQATIAQVDKVICAWGSFKQANSGRAMEVLNMIPEEKRYCIRRSKLGRPWHPLYCYDNEQFIKF